MIILIQIIKWIPPYWYNKALPTPTLYFIFTFLIISLIFVENKCLYDVIQDLKREKKKVWQKGGSNSGQLHQKAKAKHLTACATRADQVQLLLKC